MTKTCPKTSTIPLLPSLPGVVFNLLEAAEDEKKTLRELGQIAGADPALSTQILKLANSPIINRGKPINSISQAALRLGISTLRNIAVTVAICQSFSKLEFPDGFSIENFWHHSLSTGIISKKLALLTESPPSEEEAFLAGLLHDIGQLALLIKRPENFDKVVQNPRTGQTILDSEKRYLGNTHTDEGFSLLREWNIPLNICWSVRYHHEPKTQLEDTTQIVKITYLSDITSHYLFGQTNFNQEDIEKEFIDLGIKLTATELEELFKELNKELSRLANDLGLKIEDSKGKSLKLADKPDSREILKDRAIDYASLIGALESILDVRNRNELQKAIFLSLSNLINIRSILLFFFKNGVLRGVVSRGTKDDSIINQIKIINLNNSIWDKAFSTGYPIFTREYFLQNQPRLIEKQLIQFLDTEFLVLPLLIGNDPIGALAIGIKEEEFKKIQNGIETLRIFSRQVAHVLRGISYRQLWEKEHVVNEAIIKNSPVGICICDLDGNILFANPHFKELFEIDQKILSNEQIISALNSELPSKEPITVGPIRINSPGTHRKWIEIRLSLIELFGKKRGLIFLKDVTDSVLLDIEREQRALWLKSELEKKTRELKKAQERLIQMERLGAASDVARKVVHEVNNPLGIIKNLLKILKIQKETGKIEEETIDAINSEIDRVARIIKKLSDFSKNEQKAQKFSTDIKKVIDEISILYKEPLNERNINLEVQIEDSLPTVSINPDELKQVLINLIKNGQEAIEENGTIRIEVSKKEDGFITLTVADTGPGIDPNIRERLFSPFLTTKEKGSGLGLSVCFGLIKACGGDIKLIERSGFGAVFEIKLPVSKNASNGKGREGQ